jgi:hypothetical protein
MIIKSRYKTYPLVVHAPDWEKNKFWPNLVRLFCKENQVIASADLTIVTWNNLHEGVFEKSLRLKNVPFTLKGSSDVTWSNYNKFKYNIEVAKTCGTKYLMGCDSHDVILTGDPIEIVKRFEQMECKMLFNCEKHFYPNLSEPILQGWKSFQKKVSESKYQFLNAGIWIGETNFCLEFFQRANQIRVYDLFDCEPYEYLKESSIGCDQSSLHHIFSEYYPEVMLDYGCEIFFNISLPEEDELTIELPML